MDERPPVSPEKLLRQFHDWAEGTELPGRTMSYLKTGSLPELLTDHIDVEEVPRMIEVWDVWEHGKIDPGAVLEALRDSGIEGLLVSVVAGAAASS